MNNRYYRNGKSSARRTSLVKPSHLVAVHEAGHIVISCINDSPINASARKAGSVIGAIDFEMPTERGSLSLAKWQKTLLNALLMCYAGAAAEYVIFGKVAPETCDSDYAAADSYAAAYIYTLKRNINRPTENDIHVQAASAAQKLIKEFRGFFDYIVATLQKKGKITPAELAIMRELLPLYNILK